MESYWTQLAQNKDIIRMVTPDYVHYVIMTDLEPNLRHCAGFGGAKFKFRKLENGEVFESRNVWHQGTIPESCRHLFTPNAEIVN